LSSLGDVALTVPVFRTLETLLPEQKFILVSQSRYSDLFLTCPNVAFFSANLDGGNRGFQGLFKLYSALAKLNFDHIVDLHNVFRTNFLTTLFKLKGKKVIEYSKLRTTKEAMIRGQLPLARMPHTSLQYLAAFRHLVGEPQLTPGPWLPGRKYVGERNSNATRICLAPFSRHPAKEWPYEHMDTLIHELMQHNDLSVHCLAFGKREEAVAADWKSAYPRLELIDPEMSLKQQLEWLAGMDIVVSMDSANMHLASLAGTPVISIWGPTHPFLGFAPLQHEALVLQPDENYQGNRPLSRFGAFRNKLSIKESSQAMASITPSRVLEKIFEVIGR
jgi:ADP-heptose:LPS heptosyltransferase